jgi:hypothetical protein
MRSWKACGRAAASFSVLGLSAIYLLALYPLAAVRGDGGIARCFIGAF